MFRKQVLLGVVFALVFLAGCGRVAANQLALRELRDYFGMAARYFTEDHLDERGFKARYRKGYNRLLTGRLLREHLDFLQKTSLDSGEFPSFFAEDAHNRIQRLVITRQNSWQIKGYALIKDDYEFNLQEDRPELSTFVREYRLEGWTQAQFNALIKREDPISLRTVREKRYDFTLVRKLWGWRMSGLNVTILKTRLSAILSGDGREVSADTLKRQYKTIDDKGA